MIAGIGFFIIGLALGLGMGLSETPGTASSVLTAIVGGTLVLSGKNWIDIDRPLAFLGCGLIVGMLCGIAIRTKTGKTVLKMITTDR